MSLGQSVRTKNGKSSIDAPGAGAGIFAGGNTRELSTVIGAAGPVTPPVHHHSLIAELGGRIDRYREFIVFHSEYIYPEYVLAYQRFNGSHGPV